MTLNRLLEANAQRWPDKIALVERDPATGGRRTLTWRAFYDTSLHVAAALEAWGVQKGDRVALLAKNCLEWLPLYFGILRSGAWAVPLNHRFSPEEAVWCLQTAEAKVLIAAADYAPHLEAAAEAVGSLWHCVCIETPCPEADAPSMAQWLAGVAETAPAAPEPALEDEAALYFTSGTTGRHKPILLTHANLASACTVEQAHHGQTHEDVFLCIPPLYHTGAKMHWFGNLVSGGTSVILRAADPRSILESVSEEGVTIVWLLVPWAQDLLDAIERGELKLADYRLDPWRLMHMGAQPIPPSLVQRWLTVFPHHDYDTNYGLSECTGPGCVHLGVENTHKVGAIGVPGQGWRVRVVDGAGNDLPDGEVGELAVKGPGVMKAYYGNPEATAEVLRDGWLFTGDLGKRDAEGFIHLVDRKKDLVIVGGENVFPVEVEDFLRALPAVRDAAVIGAPHERLGEVVVAVVSLKEGSEATEGEILAACQGLPGYKRPRRIHFAEVPRNPTGKIEKVPLRERFARV